MLNTIVLRSNNPTTTLECVNAIASGAETKLRFFGSVTDDAVVNGAVGWTDCNLLRAEEWVDDIKQRLFDVVVVNRPILNQLVNHGITPECLVRDGGLLIRVDPSASSKKPHAYFNGVPLSEREPEAVEYEIVNVEHFYVTVRTPDEDYRFSTFGVTFKDTAEVAAFIETKMAALYPGFKVALSDYENLTSLVKGETLWYLNNIKPVGCQRLLIETVNDECRLKTLRVCKDKLTGYEDFKASLGNVELTPEQYEEIVTAYTAMETARAKSPIIEKVEWTDEGVMLFYRNENGEMVTTRHNPSRLHVDSLGRHLTDDERQLLKETLILGNKLRVEATRRK